MVEMISGTDLHTLDYVVTERVAVGSKVQLVLGLSNTPSRADLQAISAYMAQAGLPCKVECGSTGEWPDAIRITFTRPTRPQGVAVWPLAVLIIGAVGITSIGGILGWKLGSAVEGISRQIVPLTLIVAGAFVLYGYTSRRTCASR